MAYNTASYADYGFSKIGSFNSCDTYNYDFRYKILSQLLDQKRACMKLTPKTTIIIIIIITTTIIIIIIITIIIIIIIVIMYSI